MPDAKFGEGKLNDIAFMGLRTALGVIFIAHGYPKFGNEGFVGFMSSMGVPPEVAMLIALAETLAGILLIIGVLSRISASVLAIIMLAAIFQIKGIDSLTGDGGYEFDLILLAVCLVVIVMGPGRVALAHVVKKIPRAIH